jgi:hypothetical protein
MEDNIKKELKDTGYTRKGVDCIYIYHGIGTKERVWDKRLTSDVNSSRRVRLPAMERDWPWSTDVISFCLFSWIYPDDIFFRRFHIKHLRYR